jgi:cytochrome c-type biogenesis protein CcmH/NrfG
VSRRRHRDRESAHKRWPRNRGQVPGLVQELALTPREPGGAHWLVGALKLAVGEYTGARVSFEQAEQAFLSGDAPLAYALMARGYIALARKADPQCRREGADLLNQALERLRAEGSKDAIFFADQLFTADRVLIGSNL